jgi:hypothetical protein
MTSLVRPLPRTGSTAATGPAVDAPVGPRLLVAIIGIAGAVVTVYGVSRPWLSTFAGMLSQSGWGTRNGDYLVVLSAAAAGLAVLQTFRVSMALRWALAISGFLMAGFAGYLLIQVYGVTSEMDGMVLAARGPGLFIAAAGGGIVFATIFLPLPQHEAGVRRVQAVRFTGHPGFVRPLRSPLRYPAAALATVAGLAHVPVTPEHLQEAPYIGVLFIVFTVTAVLTATALLISDVPAAWLFLGGSCALAAAAYVVSRTLGLPLMADDVNNWFEPLGVLSLVTETLTAGLAADVFLRWRRRETA